MQRWLTLGVFAHQLEPISNSCLYRPLCLLKSVLPRCDRRMHEAANSALTARAEINRSAVVKFTEPKKLAGVSRAKKRWQRAHSIPSRKRLEMVPRNPRPSPKSVGVAGSSMKSMVRFNYGLRRARLGWSSVRFVGGIGRGACPNIMPVSTSTGCALRKYGLNLH